MEAEHAVIGATTWDDLPLALQQAILLRSANPCARRVCKAWRDAFDTANDTLCFSYDSDQSLRVEAAAIRIVKNSASLTAVNLADKRYNTSSRLMLSDLLAAEATSGLATRLRVLTCSSITALRAIQQLQALRQCTGLTHLDISNSHLEDCIAVELTAALQAMPRLTRLHMCGCSLQSQHVVAALAYGLQPLTQLQQLHLASSRLGAAGLAALAPALSAMPGLQTFDVSNNSLNETAGATALCTLLGSVLGLTHLDVSCSPLQEEGAALLAAVLRGMTRLQTLNMCCSQIGDGGMALLAPALAALPHLHTMDLSGNQLGASAVSLLLPVLAREGSPLRELDLSCNTMKAEGALSLASGFSAATQLRELNLKYASIGDVGWVALAPSLSRLGPSLLALQLSSEELNDAASVALAVALQTLTGLTSLKATRCFTPAAMVTIPPALMSMRRLQVLDLSVNAMSAEGTAALAAVLPALAGSLKHLALLGCISDGEAAANALAPALAQVTGLVKLHLGHNSFGPPGGQWLPRVLTALPHVRKVNLYSCKLGVQGCMAVARALKDRDGAHVHLRCNGVTIDSSEGDELCNMPGVSIYV